jgi:hypothetical protein
MGWHAPDPFLEPERENLFGFYQRRSMTMTSTTVARHAANRANSRKSTGPVTEAGKARMRNNPLRHGLTSRHVVIEGEDPEDYEALRQDLMSDWQPADIQEAALVTQIAEGAWRLMRARRVETQIFEDHMTKAGAADDHDSRVAECFHANGKQFDNLRRYATTIERAYYRALDELRNLQKERNKCAIGSVSQKHKSTNQPAPASPEIGSVSQNTMQLSVSSVFSVLKASPQTGSVSQFSPAVYL